MAPYSPASRVLRSQPLNDRHWRVAPATTAAWPHPTSRPYPMGRLRILDPDFLGLENLDAMPGLTVADLGQTEAEALRGGCQRVGQPESETERIGD